MLRLSIPEGAIPIEVRLWNGELLLPARDAVACVLIRTERHLLTLRRWQGNLQGAVFTRWWELHLAFSEAAFTVGRLQLFQFLFAKGQVHMPLDRGFAGF